MLLSLNVSSSTDKITINDTTTQLSTITSTTGLSGSTDTVNFLEDYDSVYRTDFHPDALEQESYIIFTFNDNGNTSRVYPEISFKDGSDSMTYINHFNLIEPQWELAEERVINYTATYNDGTNDHTFDFTFKIKVDKFYMIDETIDDSIGLFNPVDFLFTAISLYSMDFQGTKEEMYDTCISKFEEDSADMRAYCSEMAAKYELTSEAYKEYVDVIYNFVLSFALILVVFMFVNSYFQTFKNQNTFRQVEIVKTLFTMIITIIVMFYMKDIMLLSIRLMSVVLSSMFNVLQFSSSFRDFFDTVGNSIKNLSEFAKDLSFVSGGDAGWLDVEQHLKNAVAWILGLFLNIIISIMGVLMMVKIIVVVLERFISLSMYTVISPIFVAQYVNPESRKQGKKFYKQFIAKIMSAFILVVFLMFFVFVASIFLVILEFVFMGQDSMPFVAGVAFFYLYKLADRVIAGADAQAEKLFV